jgi:tetratricopeptide (TPR) repeat protein
LARARATANPRLAALFYGDARSSAFEAERLGARGPRTDAVIALASAELGEPEVARQRALAAIDGGLLKLGDDATPTEAATGPELDPVSVSKLLRLFADARQRAIRAAFRAGDKWPSQWLSDVNAAYSALARDGWIDENALIEHHDFLRWLGATARANAVLDDALARFPASAALHERLRTRLLWDSGPDGLESGYDDRLAKRAPESAATSRLEWFAGYASLVAAEHHRRRGEFDAALASYRRAAEHYQRDLSRFPAELDTTHHYLALGLAGEARVLLERGDLRTASEKLLAAIALRPESAASLDGLGITPVATAKMLREKLLVAGDADGGARVQAALDALDPALLEPPPSERNGSRGPRGRGGAPPGR